MAAAQCARRLCGEGWWVALGGGRRVVANAEADPFRLDFGNFCCLFMGGVDRRPVFGGR